MYLGSSGDFNWHLSHVHTGHGTSPTKHEPTEPEPGEYHHGTQHTTTNHRPVLKSNMCRWATNSAPSRRYGRNSRISWAARMKLRRESGRAARARTGGMLRGRRMRKRASRWGASRASSYSRLLLDLDFYLGLGLDLARKALALVGWFDFRYLVHINDTLHYTAALKIYLIYIGWKSR